MVPKTRLDKLVQIRERSEDSALANLARAQTILGRAQQRLAAAIRRARADHRRPGEAALWAMEEAAHVRELQAVRTAEGQVSSAAAGRQAAQAGYVAIRQKAEAARRAAQRKRSEILRILERAERKGLDELATAAFNRKR